MHNSSAEDFSLITSTLNGDTSAFGKLVDRYRTPVFNLILRLTGNYHEAEDLLQDVFIKAYEKLDGFTAGNSFFSWIYTIALNRVRNHIKRKQIISFIPLFGRRIDDDEHIKQIVCAAHEPGPEERVQKIEDMKLIRRILKELPFKYREILILRYEHDMSYEQIRGITGLPLGTVENRLYRAGRMLEGAYRKIIKE